MVKWTLKFCVIALIFLGLMRPSFAETVIVANDSLKSLKSISLNDLRKLYLGDHATVVGQKLTAYGLDEDSPTTAEFIKDILKMTPDDLRAHWMELAQSGKPVNPPQSLSDPKLLISMIKKAKASLGYLDRQDAEKSGLHILAVIP